MSSDGSVSSRVSQFGLYRTIDARTEEFLKLSKKRQIKQGCVCAAVSTALTVVVVVTFLLVYEYNVIAQARRLNYKADWLNLMNSSAHDPNLLERLSKEKIEVDRTTLKLLPILLKAINQNRYVEKVIEEPSSRFPPYKTEDSKEAAATKNIFADTRNWMKTPHPRLYTIEYKTSPIVYFKNPTRNTEYFTKIRKIRDYQRILNYVDKMIGEKNYVGSTQPMKKEYSYTEKPFELTTPFRKHKSKQKVNKQKILKKSTTNEKATCKCSYKLNDVMNKLLSSIQQLLAYFSGSSSKETVLCGNNSLIQTKTRKSSNIKSTTRKTYNVKNENTNVLNSISTDIPAYNKFLKRHRYSIDLSPTKQRDHTMNTIMNLIKPNFNKFNNIDITFGSTETFSTTNSYQKPLDINDILEKSKSISYSKYLDQTYTKTPTDAVTTVADYMLQKGIYDGTPTMKSSFSTYSKTDFRNNEFLETTETNTNIKINLDEFDTLSFELVKNNLIPRRNKDSKEVTSYPFKGSKTRQTYYNNIASMRKMGKLVSNDRNNTLLLQNLHRFAPIIHSDLKPTTVNIMSINNLKNITNNVTEKFVNTPVTLNNSTNTKNTNIEDIIPEKNFTNNISEEERTKIKKEIISNESALQHLEEAIMILNNETTHNQIQNYNEIATDTYQWKLVELEENTTYPKSMMPLSRPTYLEMQRHDWKQEENHDFDNEANNYFFE